MSSLIEGYNYDIFISYRQKDNKGDHWVSEFVEALKTELESTFKEEINVYFDINPHDGLLETHDVSESLKDKLKCLIFIPIISRTYCDPKSFAWEHEFTAFVEMASKDQFGLKVKLVNGNVANRVLPIRIHDLEYEDVKCFEGVIGGMIRTLDFVFQTSTGVNRPLKTNEDHPGDNLNKTYFQDQINKAALAIKEIVQGMKAEPSQKAEVKIHSKHSAEVFPGEKMITPSKHHKVFKLRLWSASVIGIILILSYIFAYPKIFKPDALEKLKSSGDKITVAVLPFKNMTNDTTKNFWQEMIQDNLITSLSNTGLKVKQSDLINHLIQVKGITSYASVSNSIAGVISQDLGADIFIYGSVKEIGPTLRLNAQMTDSKTQEVFRSFQIDGTINNILPIIDSLCVQVENFLVLSELIKELPADYQHHYQFSGKDPEAFRYLMYGEKAFRKGDYPSAEKFYLQALAIDPDFTLPNIMLPLTYLNQGLYKQAKISCLNIYNKSGILQLNDKIYVRWLYAKFFETPSEEIKWLRQILEIDDESPIIHYQLGNVYNDLEEFDKSIPELEKALKIYDIWESKPWWTQNYTSLGYAYHETGKYKKERKLYIKAVKDFPDNPGIIYRQAVLALSEGKIENARYYLKKYTTINRQNSVTEADIMGRVARIYSDAEIIDKAEEYYRKSLSLEPGNQTRLNNLAWLLIEKERNVNEGLELIEEALKLSPGNPQFLDTKGWGLYKLGKYQEALETLEKAWDLNPLYNHHLSLHLETARKSVADSLKHNSL